MSFKDDLGGFQIPFPQGDCLKPLLSCHLCLGVPEPLGLGPWCFQRSLSVEKYFCAYSVSTPNCIQKSSPDLSL